MKSKLYLPILGRRDISLDSISAINSTHHSPSQSGSRSAATLDPKDLRHFLSMTDQTDLQLILGQNPALAAAKDPSGLTILMHSVCRWGNDITAFETQCKVLIDSKADINAVDSDGYSVLHWASACSSQAALEYVCSIAQLNHSLKGLNGDNALHRACRLGKSANVRVLAERFPHMATDMNNDLKLPHEVAGLWMGKIDSVSRSAVRTSLGSTTAGLKSVVISHDDCLLHVPRSSGSQGSQPWESPERLSAIMKAVKRMSPDPLVNIISDFPSATDEQILRCHSSEYLKFLYSMEETLQGLVVPIPFTPAVQRSLAKLPLERTKSSSLSDTSYSEGTLTAARKACGAVCHAVDLILDGECRNAFCAVRPPGHHVGFNGPLVESSCGGSCGFSILNSVMVGAMHAIASRSKRVAVVDLDVHHGNGTQDIVQQLNRPKDLMFVSIHLRDGVFYPTTGLDSDLARNAHNVPISPMWTGESGRLKWIEAFRKQVIPLLYSFRPDIILVSMGFDGGNGDVGNCRHMVGKVSQVGLDLSPSDFSLITEELCAAANAICEGRVVSVLEGGYGKVQWTELASTASDASTRAGSEDSSPVSSLRNGRKRLRASGQFTQIINRQPLAVAATNHVKALMGLIQS